MEYRIVVRGRLSGRLASRFDQLACTPSGDVTELCGEVVDQAQLHGILDRIGELGLVLLAVQAVPAAEAARGAPEIGHPDR